MNFVKVFAQKHAEKVRVIIEPFEGKDAFVRSLGEIYGEDRVVSLIGEDSFNCLLNEDTRSDNRLRWIILPRPECQLCLVSSALQLTSRTTLLKLTPEIQMSLRGVSSTLIRKYFLDGDFEAAGKLLDPEVFVLLSGLKLYHGLSPLEIQQAEGAYARAWAEFKVKIQDEMANGRLPLIELEKFPPPSFKATQSLGAQKDKFLGWLLKYGKLSQEQAAELFYKYSSVTQS